MENNERDRKLDQWLDEALSQYSAAEPRLGMEQRVLAHIRAEQQARASRRNWWRWMPAFAAIAAVLVVMVAVRPYWQRTTANQNREALSVSKESGGMASRQVLVAPAEKKTSPVTNSSDRTKQSPAAPAAVAKGTSTRSNEYSPAPVMEAPTSSAARMMNDAEQSNVPTREADKLATAQDGKRDAPVGRNYMRIVTAANAPPQPSGVSAGGLAVAVSNTAESSADSRKRTQPGTVQAESAPAPAAPVQSGMVSTEKIASMPDVSADLNAMKAKPAGPLAKKLEQKVNTLDVMGTTLRTDLKHVAPGPVQQFPTPAPLSEQEKLMLAAAKHMKEKSANEENAGADVSPIEIKKIEIPPLPGPPKK